MVDLAELQALAYVAQIVGVIGTLTAAFIAVRSYINANKRAEDARSRELDTRQAQLFNSIYQQYTSDSMKRSIWTLQNVEFKDLSDFKDTFKDREKIEALDMLMDYFDGIGVFVREGFVDIRLVAQLMGSTIIMFWERLRKGISPARSEFNFPRMGSETEYLYDRLKEFEKAHPEMMITSPSRETFRTDAVSSQ